MFSYLYNYIAVMLVGMGQLPSRDNVIKAIVENEDVLFQWCLLSTDLEEAEEQQLLPMIVEVYVTTRGFSFANSLLEQYKQSKKRTTLKSKKALRKTLQKADDEVAL